MANYCIVAARPKGATVHTKSEFKVMQQSPTDPERWFIKNWMTIFEVAALIGGGSSVRTARLGNYLSDKPILGDPVELELRITHNDSVYKIGDMPEH